eukprot:GHUV01008834.1.p1 GENE.GHUV01008834.1~~GHUV01008834.1.p1  ORF type:complete len:285 (+),score=38.33 GHUV01008834.1:1414-2268(+)
MAAMLQPHRSIPLLSSRSSMIPFIGNRQLHTHPAASKSNRYRRTVRQQGVAAVNTTQQQQTQHTQEPSWTAVALRDPPNWFNFCTSLFAYGAVSGTLLDGIHSRVGLQVYDVAPVTTGPLVTSLIVPPLLGVFYVVLGLLTCLADNLATGPDTSAAQQRSGPAQYPYVALCYGVLAVNLYISASLFEDQIPPGQILAVLSVLTAANWAIFDCTKQGVGLAVLCGLGAPAAELILMAVAGVWHYSRPDVAGVFVCWVPLCYAFYVPALSNLARHLWQTCRDGETQ